MGVFFEWLSAWVVALWHSLGALLDLVHGLPETAWGKALVSAIAGLVVMSVLALFPVVWIRKRAYDVRATPFSASKLGSACYRRASRRIRRGNVAGALDDLDVAIGVLTELRTPSDKDRVLRVRCLDARAAVFERSERWAEAVSDLTELIAQQSTLASQNRAGWLRRRGSARDAMGAHADARTDFADAVRLEKLEQVPAHAPRSAKLWPLVEEQLLTPPSDPAQLAKARAEYDALAASDPPDVNAVYGRALLAVVAGDEAAVSLLTKAIGLLPADFANAFYWRAWARAKAGDLNGCLEDCDRAFAVVPLRGMVQALQGYALFGLGKLPESIDRLSSAIALEPQLLEAHQNLVLARIFLAQWPQAIADADRALDAGHRDPLILASRAEAELNSGSLDAAMRDASEALTLSAGSAYAYRVRGVTYYSRQRWKEAINDLTSAIAIEPQHGVSYAYRAEAHRALKQLQHAIEDADKAVECAGDIPFTRLVRALVTMARYQIELEAALLEAAEKDAQWIMATQPADALGYWARAEIKRVQGKPDEALALLRQAVARQPAFVAAHQAMGWIQVNDATTQAGEAFRLAITHGWEGDLGESYFGLAECQRLLGNFAEAIDNYERALPLAPDSVDLIRRGRAFALLEAHRDGEAFIVFDDLVRGNRDGALVDRGDALLIAGKYADSVQAYSDAIDRSPKTPNAWAARATARAFAGDNAGALVDIGRTIELEPDNPDHLTDLGWILCKLRSWQKAVDACDRAIALRPGVTFAFKNRSLALWSLQRRAEATRDLEEIAGRRMRDANEVPHSRIALAAWSDESSDWARALGGGADAVAYFGYGLCLWMSGQPAPAEQQLQHAISLDPSLTIAVELLADIARTRSNV